MVNIDSFDVITVKDLNDFAEWKSLKIPESYNKSELYEAILRKSFFNMLIVQLKKYAICLNLKIDSSLKKDEIINLIIDYFSEIKDDSASDFEINNTLRRKINNINVDKSKLLSIKEQAYQFVDRATNNVDKQMNNNIKNKVCESVELLKQYLQCLIGLESEVYFLREKLTILLSKKYVNNQRIKEFESCVTNMAKTHYDYQIRNINTVIEILEYKIEFVDRNIDKDSLEVDFEQDMPVEPQKPHMLKVKEPEYPILKKEGLFNKKSVGDYNQRLLIQYYNDVNQFKIETERYNEKIKIYENQLKQYKNEKKEYDNNYKKAKNDALKKQKSEVTSIVKKELKIQQKKLNEIEKKYNLELEKQKNILKIPQIKINELLDIEINNTKKDIKEIIKLRDELYSYNVIYKKYRNFVALTMIFEYLDSGRCNTLDGADGAYNMLESESRSNEIILKLNVVIDSLDKIKNNQYLLYSELEKVNGNLNNISDSLDEVIYELSEIHEEIEAENNNFEELKKMNSSLLKTSGITAVASAMIARTSALSAHYNRLIAEKTDRINKTS